MVKQYFSIEEICNRRNPNYSQSFYYINQREELFKFIFACSQRFRKWKKNIFGSKRYQVGQFLYLTASIRIYVREGFHLFFIYKWNKVFFFLVYCHLEGLNSHGDAWRESERERSELTALDFLNQKIEKYLALRRIRLFVKWKKLFFGSAIWWIR